MCRDQTHGGRRCPSSTTPTGAARRDAARAAVLATRTLDKPDSPGRARTFAKRTLTRYATRTPDAAIPVDLAYTDPAVGQPAATAIRRHDRELLTGYATHWHEDGNRRPGETREAWRARIITAVLDEEATHFGDRGEHADQQRESRPIGPRTGLPSDELARNREARTTTSDLVIGHLETQRFHQSVNRIARVLARDGHTPDPDQAARDARTIATRFTRAWEAHTTHGPGPNSTDKAHVTDLQTAATRFTRNHHQPAGDTDADRYVAATYLHTQRHLARHGITTVTVHRGESWATGDPEPVWENEGLTSWSTNPNVAAHFAQPHQGRTGRTRTVTVPAERVWAMPGSGPGTLRESELILLPEPAPDTHPSP